MAGGNRLTAAQVKNETRPGFYSDGGGLYLQVSSFGGTKSWVFKFTVHGKRRGMGLGPVNLSANPKPRPEGQRGTLTLAEARLEAERLRDRVRNGIDPIEAKHEARRELLKQRAEEDRRKTFEDCAKVVIEQRAKKLRNAKAIAQWESTLQTYAYPVLNDGRKIDELSKHDVAKALEPIRQTKRETASRLRGRIEAVFTHAKVVDAYKGDNPAEREIIDALLGQQSKDGKENQPALPHKRIGEFMAELGKRQGISARALEFAILTAARSGEVRGAVWDEFDLKAKTWTIPASRMKAKREHVVTLSDDAITLLEALPRVRPAKQIGKKTPPDYVFPAPRGGAMSDMALTAVVRRMHEDDPANKGPGWKDARSGRVAVVHGFRSTFRDWTAEKGYDRDMSEMALAHHVGTAVERAYRRTDMIERRRLLMQDWANYCKSIPQSNVVKLKRKATKQ